MKANRKQMMVFLCTLCLLAAALCGCSSQGGNVATAAEQERPQKESQPPEMEGLEVSAEDTALLLQAGLDAAAGEESLWFITELTDMTLLQQLMKPAEGEAGPDALPENRTPPEGAEAQRPGETMPEGERGTPPEGTFPNWEQSPEAPTGNAGDDRRKETPGRGMASAILISCTEDAAIPVETVLEKIQAAAAELGYSAAGMPVSEEQAQLLEDASGCTAQMLVTIRAGQKPMGEMPQPVG